MPIVGLVCANRVRLAPACRIANTMSEWCMMIYVLAKNWFTCDRRIGVSFVCFALDLGWGAMSWVRQVKNGLLAQGYFVFEEQKINCLELRSEKLCCFAGTDGWK